MVMKVVKYVFAPIRFLGVIVVLSRGAQKTEVNHRAGFVLCPE